MSGYAGLESILKVLKVRTLQGYLARKKLRPPQDPKGPRQSPIAGSYGGAVSYERGTPVFTTTEPMPECLRRNE